MTLAIDIGNTQTVMAAYSRCVGRSCAACGCAGMSRAACGLLSHIRVGTDISATSDVLRMELASLLDAAEAHFKDVERVAICSCVPSLAIIFQKVCRDHLSNAHVVLVGSAYDIRDACRCAGDTAVCRCAGDTAVCRCAGGDAVCLCAGDAAYHYAGDVEYQGKVGADRIANSVAAHDIYGCAAVVVVDFGTAVNFDVVSPAGVFIGGAIFPGLATSLEALVGKADGLKDADLFNLENLSLSLSLENAFDAFGDSPTACRGHSADVPIIGKNTAESIISGALHGFASMVDGMVYRLTEALHLGYPHDPHETRTAKSTVQVVATGGYAHLIAAMSNTIQQVEPFLTCHGCRVIAMNMLSN